MKRRGKPRPITAIIARRNPEIRNPKAENRIKSEARSASVRPGAFRISEFGFGIQAQEQDVQAAINPT